MKRKATSNAPSMSDFEEAKYFLGKTQIPLNPLTTTNYVNSLATFKWSPPITRGQQEEKENTMDYNLEVDQRNHLKRRLNCVSGDKENKLRKDLFIDVPDVPATRDALMTTLTGGKFTLNKDAFDDEGNRYTWTSLNEILSWRTAETQPKTKEYEVAKVLLDKAYTDAKDAIIVKPLTDGLAALQAFEAAPF